MRIRRPGSALAMAVAVVLVLSFPGLSASSLAAQDLSIIGSIVDHTTGTAIPAASFTLSDRDASEPPRRALSDADGRFRIDGVRPGIHRVTIEALGYRPISEVVELSDASSVQIRVELVPRALALDGVVVMSPARSVLDRVGFYDRRARGLGHHLTRDEILERSTFRVSDVFRTVPGARVVPRPGVGNRADVRLRGGCTPDLILDGTRTFEGTSVDDLLQVEDVEAIEVYRGSTAPAQYSHSICGAILVWTRMPSVGTGTPASWKRLIGATAFVLGAFLLTR